MPHWTRDFYEQVDSKDPKVAAWFAPDIRSQVGNDTPREGIEAMFSGQLGRIVGAVRGSIHEFVNVWDVPNETSIVESLVTYHSLAGSDVKVPATTILRRNSAGLISDLRLYIDTTPLLGI